MGKDEEPIQSIRFKAGMSVDAVAGDDATDAVLAQETIRGRALIFWDADNPDRKRDAIDTDQITPTTDCVSESIDKLDERWKAGAFRHLMPDFRERVHSGQNFLVAGDRFAIGSSREMSPAGLKALAEEAGLTLVIICGANMGDIFRRNAINLGLHVVQSPAAVADARDDDEFSFDPKTRTFTNVTQGKTYEPLALSTKEEDLRKSGGIFAVGRREFLISLRRPVGIEFPDSQTARGMTVSEQILWAHRVDRGARVAAGETLLVQGDLFPASDGTAPFAIHTFNEITGGETIYPRQAAIVNDHFVFTGKEADRKQTNIGRDFAALNDMDRPRYATPGDGIFHLYLPEQGLIVPGGFYAGADSHSRAYGAYGAVGIGVGSTALGFGWSTGAIFVTVAKQRRVRIRGQRQPWVFGKDVVLALLRMWGAEQVQGMGVELIDEQEQLSMADRHTIANMMAEAESQNGIFAQDAITEAWFRESGIAMPYPRVVAGENATYEIDEELDLSTVVPLIAKPFSPANAYPAEEVARERVRFQKAYIGSCTNGSYVDLLEAALVLRAAREKGATRVADGVDFVIFPGTRTTKQRIEEPELRLDGETVADILRGVGAELRDSWCGPCFGQGPDALASGERAITSFNRNWQNRMGYGGEGYLASPAVVAASALLGYMGPPAELGLSWRG